MNPPSYQSTLPLANSPLVSEIVDGQLRITIGVNCLAIGSCDPEEARLEWINGYKLVSADQLGNDVLNEMLTDDGGSRMEGDDRLVTFLGDMVEAALESGSMAFDECEESDEEDSL